MQRTKPPRRRTSNTFIFCAVCLATLLAGTLIWKPKYTTFHVQAAVQQSFPEQMHNSTPESLLDGFLLAYGQGSEKSLQLHKTESGTETNAGDVVMDAVWLSTAPGASQQESTVTLRCVSHSAPEALAATDGIAQNYIAFAQQQTQDAGKKPHPNQAELSARFQELAENAEKRLHDFVANYLHQKPSASRATASTDIPPANAEGKAPGEYSYASSSSNSVQQDLESESATQPDPQQIALWYAMREQLNRSENHLNRLLVDVNDSHPRVRKLAADIEQTRREFEKLLPPPTAPLHASANVSGLKPAAPPIPANEQNAAVDVTATDLGGRRDGTIEIAGPQQPENQEEFQELKEQAKEARLTYEQSRDVEHQAQQESLAADSQNVASFRLQPARIVRATQPPGFIRWGCLLLLGIGAGLLATVLVGTDIQENADKGLVADVEHARQLVPAPILATIPAAVADWSRK